MPTQCEQIEWLIEQVTTLLDEGCGCDECIASQDNRNKVINFGSTASPTDAPVDVSTVINNLPDNATDYKTVIEEQMPLFEGYVSKGRGRASYNKYRVTTGKGIYGQGGDIVLTEDNMILIEEKEVGGSTVFEPIDNDPNADVRDLGEIPDGDFLTVINAGAQFTISAGTNQYFEFTVGGKRQLWSFDGPNGTYGSGGLNMVDSHVFLIYDENNTATHTHEGYRESGLRTLGTLLAIMGDFDISNNGTRLVVDVANELIELISSDIIQLNGNVRVSDGKSFGIEKGAFIATLSAALLTSSRTHNLPDESGELDLKRQVKIALTTPQILALNTTGITAIPTPGAGKAINILSATARNNFGTVAFDAPDKLALVTSGATDEIMSFDTGFVNSASSVFSRATELASVSTQIVENQPVELKILTGDPTVGDGTIDVYINYEIITL